MSEQVMIEADPQRMAEEIEHLEYENDVLAARLAAYETANQEYVPGEMIRRMSDGESPTRVWREHRGLEAANLARSAGLTEQDLARLEAGAWEPGLRAMSRIARVLRVDVDDLVPWPQDNETE